jgi:energy-coupling factor transporter ATP-binding protein EcfA2
VRITDRVRQAVGRTAPPEAVVDRVEALRRFVDVATGHLPDERLSPARTVVNRAGERLSLSREHTVVALAGATGSGKSSLFNALAGLDLSEVGLLRPTTGAPHACVWGAGSAQELLDWLGVPAARRHRRESALDGGDDATLRGLVLLDLPDFDSVEQTHRVEVDRLLVLVDLIVWVLDPQKYADRLVHKQYLAQFHRHRDITVVLLNKADLLTADDVKRCVNDLKRLLDDDGLGGVPVFATSVVGPARVQPLRELLERAVAARQAALRRLAGDVDVVVADLAPHFASDITGDAVDSGSERALVNALATAAGVPVVAGATERAYRHRAIGTMGWPVARWLRRLRPDPLRRLRLGGRGGDQGALEPVPIPATSVPPPSAAAKAGVGLAVRTLGQRAGERLPVPWPVAVLTAARSRMDDVPDALDVAIARTDLGVPRRRPFWWRVVGGVQWLAALIALVGLVWLGVRLVLFAVGVPGLLPEPQVGRLSLPTVLFFGGLLAGLLTSIVMRPIVRIAARRTRARATARMMAAVTDVARTMVIRPVRDALDAYREARAALRDAGLPSR